MKTVLVIFLFASSSFAWAAGHEAKGADAQAVNSACASDSATAGCAGEKVGTGLMKCLWAYKKAHKDFKFSDGCKSAMEKKREDKMK